MLLERLKKHGFQIEFRSHAEAILSVDFPLALLELEQALRSLTIPIDEIIRSGGGETKGTQRLRRSLSELGWQKGVFEIKRRSMNMCLRHKPTLSIMLSNPKRERSFLK